MKKNFLMFSIFFLISLLVYAGLHETFYQQDEWHSLGRIHAFGISYVFSDSSFVNLLLLESRPLARLTNFTFFGLSPLNMTPIFIFAVFFHALNAFLVYKLAKHFNMNNIIAAIAALFFLLSSSGKQAVLWFGTVAGTLQSTAGILASLYFFLKYLDSNGRPDATFSILFLILSLGFKESGLFLLLLFPLLEISKNMIKKKKLLITAPSIILLLVAIVTFVVKFTSVYFVHDTVTRYISVGSGGGLIRLLWNTLTFPIESFSQILIPAEVVFPLSRRIIESGFSYFETSGYAGLISELIVVELVSVLLSFLIIIPLVLLLSRRKEKWPVVFILLFYFLSFIPYLVLIKPNGYLESRYYYLATIPVTFMLGISFQNLLEKSKKVIKQRNAYLLFSCIIFISIGLYFMMHISFINDQLNFLKERGVTQKHILSEITRQHSSLSQKQVFYIESDHSFIVPNNPLPFQNGIGYTLLVAYAYKNNTDRLNPFLLDNFFWKLGNQGYFEKKGQGFGFFTDLDEVRKQIENGKFRKDNITAFRYDSVRNKIYDITKEIQGKLE